MEGKFATSAAGFSRATGAGWPGYHVAAYIETVRAQQMRLEK